MSAWVGAAQNWPGDGFFTIRKSKFWEHQFFSIVTFKYIFDIAFFLKWTSIKNIQYKNTVINSKWIK